MPRGGNDIISPLGNSWGCPGGRKILPQGVLEASGRRNFLPKGVLEASEGRNFLPKGVLEAFGGRNFLPQGVLEASGGGNDIISPPGEFLGVPRGEMV